MKEKDERSAKIPSIIMMQTLAKPQEQILQNLILISKQQNQTQ